MRRKRLESKRRKEEKRRKARAALQALWDENGAAMYEARHAKTPDVPPAPFLNRAFHRYRLSAARRAEKEADPTPTPQGSDEWPSEADKPWVYNPPWRMEQTSSSFQFTSKIIRATLADYVERFGVGSDPRYYNFKEDNPNASTCAPFVSQGLDRAGVVDNRASPHRVAPYWDPKPFRINPTTGKASWHIYDPKTDPARTWYYADSLQVFLAQQYGEVRCDVTTPGQYGNLLSLRINSDWNYFVENNPDVFQRGSVIFYKVAPGGIWLHTAVVIASSAEPTYYISDIPVSNRPLIVEQSGPLEMYLDWPSDRLQMRSVDDTKTGIAEISIITFDVSSLEIVSPSGLCEIYQPGNVHYDGPH